MRPRSHGYTALALFLVLGFWAKAVAHLVLSYPYIEPTGAFRGTGMAWDQVLSVAIVAALGAIAARVLFLAALWRRPRAGRDPAPPLPPPGWYERYRAWAWGACLLAVVLVAGWNSVAAFYQIGVQPKLLLPLRLHILPAWLVSIGFGLALAALVQWEWARSPRALPLALTGAVLEAALSSASALSRSIYVLRVLPYVLTLADRWHAFRAGTGGARVWGVLAAAAAGAVLTLALVTLGRLYTYPAPYVYVDYSEDEQRTVVFEPFRSEDLPTDVQVPEDEARRLRAVTVEMHLKQLAHLLVDRWVGLEGVMAVSAAPDLGWPLLRQALSEDPGQGAAALYQRIARATAADARSEGYTFLTLPGLVAVLFYSGSLLVVGLGVGFLTGLVMALELLARWWVGGPFVPALVGVALANVACQLHFPYLAAVFLMQLVLALPFLGLVARLGQPGPRPAASGQDVAA